MFKKKWTVVRIIATEQQGEPAIYYPSDTWFWFNLSAERFARGLEKMTHARGIATVIAGTGWKAVTRQTLETMKSYDTLI